MVHWAWLILAFLCGVVLGATLFYLILKATQAYASIQEAAESLKGKGI